MGSNATLDGIPCRASITIRERSGLKEWGGEVEIEPNSDQSRHLYNRLVAVDQIVYRGPVRDLRESSDLSYVEGVVLIREVSDGSGAVRLDVIGTGEPKQVEDASDG